MTYAHAKLTHPSYEKNFNVGIVPKIKSDLFYNVFYKLFDVIHADTEALKEEAHRIRYKVFCLENEGYEDPAEHPDGMERDIYDANASHALLIYKPTGRAIGTVRVIKPNPDNWRASFPMQNLCDSKYLHNETYVKNSCEFSRLCISQELRNEVKNEVRALSAVLNFKGNNPYAVHEKLILKAALSAAPLGLIRGAFELSVKNNVLNVFSIMEPRHIERLQRAGMIHEQIGPEMIYHGTRVPFLCNILEVYEHAIVNNHEIWNVVSVQGKNHRNAYETYKKQGASEH